jgi:tetratricopeptide (TPR) repeat protein
MTRWEERLHWLFAGLVLLVTQVVYLKTMTITCPFWDSGEYIATSYILGIAHPPSNPLYILIGRLFSILPIFPLVATRVNWISALASTGTAVFTYLLTVELWLRIRRRGASADPSFAIAPGVESAWGRLRGVLVDHWPGIVAGLVAAFFTAFSQTFWGNAIEAEVNAPASFIMALAAWLIVRWARMTGSRAGKTGLFLLVYYLVCLSMGIHLSTFLVLPGIILFALLVDRESFGSTRLEAWIVAGLVLLLHPGLLPTLRLGWGVLAAGVLVLCLLGSLGLVSWKPVGRRGLLTWCLILAILGLSTHFFLMIRAHANPAINEADPESWRSLWKALSRDQYKPPSPFARQAPWSVQLTKHWFDYAKDQYSLGLKPEWVGWLLPYLLGFAGAARQASRDWKGFAKIGTIWFCTSLLMVFYLNFKTDEVRGRDYFFTGQYQFFAIWIGLGASWMVESARKWFATPAGAAPPAARPVVAGALGLLLCGLPFLTANRYWYEHDRTGFWVARDFAWNMLTPLKPNAILFTNGDNDTFPLWYIQEVEGFRKDVRVANLSLLNTDWYIRQLRDDSPQIDLGWSDTDIAEVTRGAYYDQERKRVIHINDQAVARIVGREYGKRPIYVAVTVPDLMGLEDALVMQGLVFELQEPLPGARDRVDADATLKNLREVYKYRGLLLPDGNPDNSVYKDENARRLSQNYAAGLVRAAQEKSRQGDYVAATEAMRLGGNIAPTSRAIQYTLAALKIQMRRPEEAEALLQSLAARGWGDARLFLLLGRSLEEQDKPADAEAQYRRALALAPNDFDTLSDLFYLLWQKLDRGEEGIALLQDWARRHPDDRRVTEALEELGATSEVPGGKPGTPGGKR